MKESLPDRISDSEIGEMTLRSRKQRGSDGIRFPSL
jgi:hypothetical protein